MGLEADVIKKLAKTIVEKTRAQAGDFLDDHRDALAFLEERAVRFATLEVKYALAGAAERPAIESEIDAVVLSIETESLNVALDAEEASRIHFKDVLSMIFGFAKEAIPILISLI